MRKAIVLVSGGMDSCVTAAIAKDMGYELYLLHTNYGQRTENRELKAFYDIASYYDAKDTLVVSIDYLKKIGGSALTDEKIEVEKGNLNRKEIPKTYVPFRNANILSIATSWAEVIEAERIFIGAVEEDSSGYPDCRKIFYDKFNDLLSVALAKDIGLKVETPLINMKKKDIVKKGVELNAPLHLSWSCYKSEDKACGECDSCLLRLKGFMEAGEIDPIPYEKFPEFYETYLIKRRGV
ncbi:transcriptional regulator, ExsB family [Deferribacter desulfuricans SSM1]|uniref:7-cyano-7-deazaguanine synthase n=1 Tax=Deferribacter desulfuricans (strain DSM 14783 / JCM 11476 / NBRC 101012 / SSM1) TaxID=639282 RepID=D3PCT8_DEFDS|nr:7-cyano-7-deazaguanine synthase QueC [Deferribacter desulfuricans]BAI80411.1 transcriptional regulator, ExsB family [Deferribacter desulfuricans SSM1]